MFLPLGKNKVYEMYICVYNKNLEFTLSTLFCVSKTLQQPLKKDKIIFFCSDT